MSQQLDTLTAALDAASISVTAAAARVAVLPQPQPADDLTAAIARAGDIKTTADAIAPAQP